MLRRLIVAMFVVSAFGVFVSPAGIRAHVPVLAGGQSQHQHESPPADAQRRNDTMTCHRMMAEMKAADSRLEQLVKEMNDATGDAKVAAIAQIVTELVRQRPAMHDRMAAMDGCRMMNGRSSMMKK
jgi:hypothetical protein